MAFDPDIQCGMTQEQAERIGRLKDQARTDPRTHYPKDGTIVMALFNGNAHWYTGKVRYDPTDRMHRMDCPELEGQGAVGFLEDAAHWYEPV